MSLDNIGLFKVIDEKMNWLGQRQKVIAQNIANSDSPSYQPQQISEFSFREALRGAPMAQPNASTGKSAVATTTQGHLGALQGENGEAREKDQKRVYETAPDGNAVIIEEQMMKASETAMEYQTMANLYKKNFDLMMVAIGKGN